MVAAYTRNTGTYRTRGSQVQNQFGLHEKTQTQKANKVVLVEFMATPLTRF